ncbi:anhydro-N-acetylmuramic acid kinase [Candidatus Dependentiae bacterium]|nr:anhydro-N-acetylmuramic acid kinase [Candidatus Dependentiae bacterium]
MYKIKSIFLVIATIFFVTYSKPLRIIGVMTGTSCDGIDMSCLLIDKESFKFEWFESYPYPKELRNRVLELQKENYKMTLHEILQLDHDIGLCFAEIIAKLIDEKKDNIDLIALHGQTVAHYPYDGTTEQLGDPSLVAYKTGISTVYNFRKGDLAAGGQGAPLVPIFHKLLISSYKHLKNGIAIHNIGGISNFTYLCDDGQMIGFDTGPGNMYIDAAVARVTDGIHLFDPDGSFALRGKIIPDVLQQLLEHKFFSLSPPKSTGRDDFNFSKINHMFVNKDDDMIATLTMLTVESIARAYENWIIGKGYNLSTIIICGGGAYNKTLMNWLQNRLPSIKIISMNDIGLNNQAIESQACAYWGYLSLYGEPLGGTWTGADSRKAVPGFLIPGKNWQELVHKLQF